jgi:FkbM family methyltransferase
MKPMLKALLARTPYRVSRRGAANRFQAIEDCLQSLRARDYRPRIVVDGGAHVGEFSLMAKRHFPDAAFHLFEPQQACVDAMRRVCAAEGFVPHVCALAERGGTLRFSQTSRPNTGGMVAVAERPDTTEVTACSLDGVFRGEVDRDDRVLLKLDLQGYELHALKGAADLLRSVEVVLSEVSFYTQFYAAPIAELIGFLNGSGFELYDIASLSARPRDNRPREADFVFVRSDSLLLQDGGWD